MDSIRDQVIAAVQVAVGGEWWLPTPEALLDLPFCLVQDGEEEAETDVYGITRIGLPILVMKAEVAQSQEDREIMRKQCDELLAGIRRDMLVDKKLGGVANNVSYTSGSIQAEVGRFCFAQANFIVSYQTAENDPYSINNP